MKSAPRKTEPEEDDAYVVRCMERYIDEIRRKIATKESSLVRIGVKIENGSVISIKAHSEDDFDRIDNAWPR